MAQCVAVGCKNKKIDKLIGITFHTFPRDKVQRKSWEVALRRDFKATNSSLLCSTHFKEGDFDRSSPFITKLKQGVVPSNFPGLPDKFQNNVKERHPIKRHNDVQIILHSSYKNKIQKLEKHYNHLALENAEKLKIMSAQYKKKSEELEKSMKNCSRLNSVSERRLKKLKIFRERNRLLQNKVVKLQDIVEMLKEQDEDRNMLKCQALHTSS